MHSLSLSLSLSLLSATLPPSLPLSLSLPPSLLLYHYRVTISVLTVVALTMCTAVAVVSAPITATGPAAVERSTKDDGQKAKLFRQHLVHSHLWFIYS